MSWAWEYEPSEDQVVGGAPPALVAEVEKKADELVRAAAALYLDGTVYQGPSPRGENVLVPGGMFFCQVVPRHERVYVFQITGW
ncbi:MULTISPECIES: hypothetical protein [Streptomyces]|uniref:Uncharacterized protein n=2 Tax=Streptomyces TaxID=1883 RepID=A0ABT9KN92_9ACTN|nr:MULTISPECIES: hypothetical protein [Streptomyces]MDP9609650.1 hypothetical protein [Streptomyces demainii]GHJ27885.1 hypothetical protein TPA0910_23180 [Streptomyces hygroscopicus]